MSHRDELDPGTGFLYALSWHDVTCPEGEDCRARSLHAASEPLYVSGLLERYEEQTQRLAEQRVQAHLQGLDNGEV